MKKLIAFILLSTSLLSFASEKNNYEIYVRSLARFNNLSAEQVLKYFLEQRLQIKDLDKPTQEALVSYSNEKGLLFWLVEKNNIPHALEVFKNIIDLSGTDLHRKDKNGNTLLICASRYGLTDIVTYLLQKNVPIDTKGAEQGTALYWATAVGYFEIVKILVEHGANIGIPNKERKTPLIVAIEENYTEIAHFLNEHSKKLNVKI